MKTDLAEHGSKLRKEYEIISTPPHTKISLWFDGYDDIFSDFDPRPYSRRIISDDFLNELRKVVSEVKTSQCDITFLIPRGRINHTEEKIIQARLHHYFHNESLHLQSKARKLFRRGLATTFVGMTIMFLTAALVSQIEDKFVLNLLMVICEPTGWFTVWYGLDHIFYISREGEDDLDFATKLLKAEINFDAY